MGNGIIRSQRDLALTDVAEITRLDRARYGRARRALGAAFQDYNLMIYAAADARRREPAVLSLYNAILADTFRWGEVLVTADVVGAACWLPPGKENSTLWRQLRSGMWALPWLFGVAGFRRLVAYDSMAQKLHHAHAPMPHWYLAAIGVEPDQQGKGVGGALMQPILARADAAGLHSYLETHRESNVRLYERHGFQITEQAEVPGHPLPVWAMLRKPR